MKNKWIASIVAASLILAAAAAGLAGCGAETGANGGNSENGGQAVEMTALETGMAIVKLLRDKDMDALAGYAHPEKGVRFSPYAYIDTAKDRVLSAAQLSEALQDEEKYIWGAYDGSGEPIELAFSDYYDEFIYSADFAEPQIIGNDTVIGAGNSINNIREAYPDAVFVEFHFKGFDQQYEGMDWCSLRIVLEKSTDGWYLVGIVHDQWTI